MERWEVIEPYARQEEVLVTRDSEVIVIVKASNVRHDKKMHFPSTAFKIKE